MGQQHTKSEKRSRARRKLKRLKERAKGGIAPRTESPVPGASARGAPQQKAAPSAPAPAAEASAPPK